MPISEEPKLIIASDLAVAHELRKLVYATLDTPQQMDCSEEIIEVFKRITARLMDQRV
jgi:hypothetical protein